MSGSSRADRRIPREAVMPLVILLMIGLMLMSIAGAEEAGEPLDHDSSCFNSGYLYGLNSGNISQAVGLVSLLKKGVIPAEREESAWTLIDGCLLALSYSYDDIAVKPPIYQTIEEITGAKQQRALLAVLAFRGERRRVYPDAKIEARIDELTLKARR
jgi:hypothetical protein